MPNLYGKNDKIKDITTYLCNSSGNKISNQNNFLPLKTFSYYLTFPSNTITLKI